MPFIKVEYGSSANISVQGIDYFEVEEEDLNEDGTVPGWLISQIWQDAVNEFMSDTYADIVQNEGD